MMHTLMTFHTIVTGLDAKCIVENGGGAGVRLRK